MDKQTAYEQRQKERGLTLVKVWIPTEYRGKLLDFAEQLRRRKQKKAGKQ